MAPAGVSREAAPSSLSSAPVPAGSPADQETVGGSSAGSGTGEDADYQPPAVFDLGSVWRVTLGSSSNGSADANSHYYW